MVLNSLRLLYAHHALITRACTMSSMRVFLWPLLLQRPVYQWKSRLLRGIHCSVFSYSSVFRTIENRTLERQTRARSVWHGIRRVVRRKTFAAVKKEIGGNCKFSRQKIEKKELFVFFPSPERTLCFSRKRDSAGAVASKTLMRRARFFSARFSENGKMNNYAEIDLDRETFRGMRVKRSVEYVCSKFVVLHVMGLMSTSDIYIYIVYIDNLVLEHFWIIDF